MPAALRSQGSSIALAERLILSTFASPARPTRPEHEELALGLRGSNTGDGSALITRSPASPGEHDPRRRAIFRTLTIKQFAPRFSEYEFMAGRNAFGRLDVESNHDDDE